MGAKERRLDRRRKRQTDREDHEVEGPRRDRSLLSEYMKVPDRKRKIRKTVVVRFD